MFLTPQVPTFKAQPLPDFHAVVLPEKKVAEPTKPEPFKLLLDERGAAKNDRWEQMVRNLYSIHALLSNVMLLLSYFDHIQYKE